MRQWFERLRFLLTGRGRRFRRELDAELRFHLDMRSRALEDEGLPADEARRRARLELGNPQIIGEDSRAPWTVRGLEQAVQDLRYGWRTAWRRPAFSLAIVLTLALGVGANAAIFSVVDAVLLRPLPYRDPSRLVLLWSTTPTSPLSTLTPGDFLDFRRRATSFSSLSGVSHTSLALTDRDGVERLPAMSVSMDFFQTLGVEAARGRTFTPADGAGARVAVLSHRLWVARFNSDPSIVGRSVTLDGEPYVVLGVMASTFALPSITTHAVDDDGPSLWVPAGSGDVPRGAPGPPSAWPTDRRTGYLRAVGRLEPGTSLEAARTEVSAIAADLAAHYPDDAGQGATVVSFADHLTAGARQPLTLLFAAAGLVLLLACVNIAGLLVGRSSARQEELAVRLSLGATRGRVVSQLVTEALLLSAIAGVVGVSAGAMALRALLAMGTARLLRLDQSAIDGRTIAFAMAAALATGLLFSLLPALQSVSGLTRAGVRGSTTRVAGGRGRHRARQVLVAAEVALATALVVGALLFARSLWTMLRVDPGYDPRGVLAFQVNLGGGVADNVPNRAAAYERIVAGLRALPGVTDAGAVVNLPVGGDTFGAGFEVEGAPVTTPAASSRANYQVAGAGYFSTLDVPVVSGRDFGPGDTPESTPVVIVNQALADRAWPGREAVGRRLRLGQGTGPWRTVVGVVGNIRHGGLSAPVPLEIYQPDTQRSFGFMSFVARTSGDPLALAPAVRRLVAQLEPGAPVSGLSTLESRLQGSAADVRFLSILLGAFAGMALLLAGVGIYGVVALGVAERAREIGIRIALGAGRLAVLGLVVRQTALVSVVGLTAGLAVTLAAGRLVAGLLFGVTPHDAATFVAVPLVLASVAVIAAAVPARRAVTTPASDALRALP